MTHIIKSKLLGIIAMLAVTGANASTVSVDPSVLTVAPGSSFTAAITADFTAEGGASEGGFLLSWDPAVLTLNEAASGASADIAGDIVLDFAIVDPVFGELDYSYSTCLLACAPSTVYGVYDLSFDVNPAASGDTPIALTIGVIGDRWSDANGDLLPNPTFNGATITVSAVPVPAAAWLFASGLLGLVGVARRRSI